MDIRKLDRNALKSFFVKNAIPTEGNFKDLIDGMINQKDDGIVKLPHEPLSLQADSYATSQKVINFYGDFADPKPAWTLSLNPYVDPANPATARPGWNIGDADGKSRLFIDQNTGNIGVGTVNPASALDVRRDAAGALGPVLSLTNASGAVGAGAAIDFSDDDTQNQPPVARIQSMADGSFSSHLIFSTKRPGAAANPPIEVLRLTSEGNVGIGTPGSPTAKLDVNGIVRVASGWDSARDPDSAMSKGGSLVIKSNCPQIDFLDTDGNDWSIHVNGNKMRFIRQPWDDHDLVLDGAGKVGIGTADPVTTLDVMGDIAVQNKLAISGKDPWLRLNPEGHFEKGIYASSFMVATTLSVGTLERPGQGELLVGAHIRAGGNIAAQDISANNIYAKNKLTVKDVEVTSDIILKKDLKPLTSALEKLQSLRGVVFSWKDAASGEGEQIGVIAQEVEEVFPELVSVNDGRKFVKYLGLIAVLIEAVKEQQVLISQLREGVRGYGVR